jgi:cytochrome c oxidase subunit 2
MTGAGRRHAVAVILFAALALLAAGCGDQSTLSPHSKASRDIATLWWWMLGAAGVVFFGALFLLLLGWTRRRKRGLPVFGEDEGLTTGLVVTFGIAVPVVTLIALFVVANFSVVSATQAPKTASTAMTIQVIGHQWFWEVRYPGTTAVTANEIHIPARTRVNVVATTTDVIHSLWVPELNRKIDMIPGHRNRVLLYADRPGVYRGQCAEFCGPQHAHMSMKVFAQPPDRFRAWLRNMAAPRRAPSSPELTRGEQVFVASACASCHTIRGTSAHGDVGPDLTHLATRTTLAALTIPNRRGYLGGWILDPQHIKPGAKMPAIALGGADFQAVLDYLQSLR